MSSDPFEREKAIRRGDLDDEMPGFSELTGWLQRVPITWLPGLLVRTVAMCVIRGVFKDGGMERAVQRGIAIGTDPNLSALRDDDL